jgi:hypothetical protein
VVGNGITGDAEQPRAHTLGVAHPGEAGECPLEDTRGDVLGCMLIADTELHESKQGENNS